MRTWTAPVPRTRPSERESLVVSETQPAVGVPSHALQARLPARDAEALGTVTHWTGREVDEVPRVVRRADQLSVPSLLKPQFWCSPRGQDRVSGVPLVRA